MLNDGFTGAEWSRYCCGTALGNREQGVDYTLTGDHRNIRRELFFIWTLDTNRPFLEHTNIADDTVCTLDSGDGLGDVVATGEDFDDFALRALWNHDLVCDDGGFLNGTQNIAHYNMVADLGSSNEIPFLIVIQRGDLDASGDIASGNLSDFGQRTLDTVKDTGQHARSQFNRHRSAGGLNIIAGADAGSFLIYLNGCLVVSHLDDFTDELLLADMYYVEHIGVAHIFGNDQRTGNLYNFALAQYFHLL